VIVAGYNEAEMWLRECVRRAESALLLHFHVTLTKTNSDKNVT